jgi:hypothetical protein
MIGENWLLVTDEPAGLGNNQFKFKTSGWLPTQLEEFAKYSLNYVKENPKDVNM